MRNFTIIACLVALLAFSGCTSTPLKEGTTADGHAYRGSGAPKVVIYEYSDFECPFCSRAQTVIEDIMQSHSSEVQLQFRHFPLTDIHPRSMASALAAVCAEEQGKFWPMHDKMFANQDALEDADLKKYAQGIGLDMANFTSCVSSQRASDRVQKDTAAGLALGVRGTPSFAVGSTLVVGTPKLKQVVENQIAVSSG